MKKGLWELFTILNCDILYLLLIIIIKIKLKLLMVDVYDEDFNEDDLNEINDIKNEGMFDE